jgi:hypothetical protein
MATTSRRQKKIVKPVIEVKAEVIEEVKEKKNQLMMEHLKDLEIMSRDIKNAKLTMAVEEQSLQNLSLNLELLKNKIEKQQAFVVSSSNKYEAMKLKFANLRSVIIKEYGLDEKKDFGYDPISGELKQ